jgi:poly(A) polymerase
MTPTVPSTANQVLPSLAEAAWLRSAATQAVLGCLVVDGHAARVVGGAVRNALLGLPVGDIDIATTATPAQVIAAAARAKLHTIPTGLQHGTVTVRAGKQSFEVTTLRQDVATDGRHATVAFTDNWAADARRRDLTVNAFYCDAAGTVFDPLGGIDDLRARRVRFIGVADQRIAEDYLRILRFFRFTAEYADGAHDPAGLTAAIAGRAGLALLSAERVHAELLRLLVARRAGPVIEAMVGCGLLTHILPIAPRLGVFTRLVAIETANALRPHGCLRLAALAVATVDDADRLAARLRLSAAERETLQRAADPGDLTPKLTAPGQRAALYRRGASVFCEHVLLNWARGGAAATDAAWQHLLALPSRWTAPKLPLTGHDLIAMGCPAGPEIGRLLSAFEVRWVAEDFPDEAARHDRILSALMAKN